MKTSLGLRQKATYRRHQAEEYVFRNPGKAVLRQVLPGESRVIDTRGERWVHSYYGRMDWREIQVYASLKNALQHYFFHRLESSAPLSAFSKFSVWKRICRRAGERFRRPLTGPRAMTVLGRLNNDEMGFVEFRNFYRWSVERNIQGASHEVLLAMERLKPPSKKKRIDPRDSRWYLTDEEERRLTEALEKEPSHGGHFYRNHVLVQIAWELGCRVAQIRAIDERHIRRIEAAGRTYYEVDVPRVKQRTEGYEVRSRAVSDELGRRLLSLIEQNHKNFRNGGPDSPVFRTYPKANIKTLHCGSRMAQDTLSYAIKDWIDSVLQSDVNRGATCLRHNMAQRLADMGAPASVLREALDHSDDSSIKKYIRATPNIGALKTRALGKSKVYQQIMDWIKGTKPVSRGEVEPWRIVQGMVADRYIGNIGACDLPATAICPKNPVYSCYGCPAFTPFLKGEHGKVADAMAKENMKLAARVGFEGNRTVLTNEYPIMVARVLQQRCDHLQGKD